MQEPNTGVGAGAVVHARGAAWTVVEVRTFDDCALVTLDGRGPDVPGHRTTLIAPFDAITRAPRPRLTRRRRSGVTSAVLGAIGGVRQAHRLWTAVGARFTPLAWQLSPALAVLGGATRLLLADAVGLGKTVQAGLIIAELMARGLVQRALVLTPASLREVWASELGSRFRLAVEALDQASILAHREWQAAARNPWVRVPIVVSSIDLVKRPEVRAAVDDEPIDLLVVDEAHHCTPGSDRGAVVARLARTVPWVVLVSATPHTGDPRAFHFLLELGRVSPDEPAMRVFRRTRHDAGFEHHRSTHVLAVTPTDAERRLQEAVVAYARDLCSGPMRHATGLRLVGGVLARRAASSALAARRTLARRLAALSGESAATAEHQPQLPWLEVEDEDLLGASWLGMPGLRSTEDECARLRALITWADEACAHPSKLLRLQRLVSRVGEPVIVFTEFRDTLEACLPFVSHEGPVRCLHGGLDVADRRRAVSDFLEGRARVLLATDVAGEGLSLHTRARLVVTIEWPWSPQRLEQRIGRVDRLGQVRRVHAVHLTSRGTFEDTVVARLLARARSVSRDLDRRVERDISERTVEATVLGEPDGGAPAFNTPASVPGRDAAAAVEARRILAQRRLCQHRRRTTSPPAWCLPARKTRPRRVVVVFEACGRSSLGRLDGCSMIGIEVTLAQVPGHRLDWKRLCRALAEDGRVLEAARRAAHSVTSPADRPRQSVTDRLVAIRHALDLTSTTGVQASLFDRRTVREAGARKAVTARMHAHLEQKIRVLSSAGGQPELSVLAVLPLA
jgi:superfamily II DNA or RNA helicase